jgi:tryptophan 2,3-dioxygenase
MENKNEKYSTIHYQNYLELGKILNAQNLRSVQLKEPAHEEMLFIITHQVYELWFKQIIHELTSVLTLFKKQKIDERSIGVAVGRLQRIEEILKLLVEQIGIMETMTPLDFLDFRNYLFPASGFQSLQFREVECLLGLPEKQRITYHNHSYKSVFPADQQEKLNKIYAEGTLFDFIEDWLERTPFLKLKNFDFLKQYEKAVKEMIEKEQQAIQASHYLTDKEKEMRSQMLGSTDTYFELVFNKEKHDELRANGAIRLSYKATLAALFINLYRDEPILHSPFKLLTNLVDIDELLTNWRYRHAQMVLRMLGRKIGTGGSSGHQYLSKTAEKHMIFSDFHNISTLLIPRSALPKLPASLKKQLSFYFSKEKK